MTWRRWLRLFVATAFAAAMARVIWVLEWFDVWRQGIPPASLLLVYACNICGAGVVGWLVASLLTRRRAKA